MRKKISILFLILAILSIIVSLIADWGFNLSSICRWASLVFLLLVAFLNYGWCRFVRFLNSILNKKAKERCFHYSKEECPYGDKKECAFDTTNCRVFGKNKQKRRISILWPLLVFSLCLTIFCELVLDYEDFSKVIGNFNMETLYKILQPIVNSIIAALIISILIDIPGRMKEYQAYFIELLSSSDYLKKMSEEQLTNLRKEVTWLLHGKDYPNMPRKLIDMDEKFCQMLKMPYYKLYSQTVTIENENNGNLKKKINIEYTAFNPQHKDNPTIMDISFTNSLCFENNIVTPETARLLFSIQKMTCSIDNFDEEMDLVPSIRIGVSKEDRDGFLYNGRVTIISKNEGLSNKENPLKSYDINYNARKTQDNTNQQDNANQQNNLTYEMIEGSEKSHLYLSFCDKLKVKIQYEVVVPEKDTSYTKRLRYPAKYFDLDYTFKDDVPYTVVGQLIGTLIDQPDITVRVSDDKKNIRMKTRNWLLPKNGAVIVHCNAINDN